MHEEKNKINAKYRACFIGRLHIVYCFKTGIFYIIGQYIAPVCGDKGKLFVLKK